jgi:hypothetical protein
VKIISFKDEGDAVTSAVRIPKEEVVIAAGTAAAPGAETAKVEEKEEPKDSGEDESGEKDKEAGEVKE